MSEPSINLKAKIDGKEVVLEIEPSDLDEFYKSFWEYRRAYERAHKDKIVREAAEIAVNEVRQYQKTHDDAPRVIFNVFQDEDRDIYEDILG